MRLHHPLSALLPALVACAALLGCATGRGPIRVSPEARIVFRGEGPPRTVTAPGEVAALVACLDGAPEVEGARGKGRAVTIDIAGTGRSERPWLYAATTGRFTSLNMKTSPVHQLDAACRDRFARALGEAPTAP